MSVKIICPECDGIGTVPIMKGFPFVKECPVCQASGKKKIKRRKKRSILVR